MILGFIITILLRNFSNFLLKLSYKNSYVKFYAFSRKCAKALQLFTYFLKIFSLIPWIFFFRLIFGYHYLKILNAISKCLFFSVFFLFYKRWFLKKSSCYFFCQRLEKKHIYALRFGGKIVIPINKNPNTRKWVTYVKNWMLYTFK